MVPKVVIWAIKMVLKWFQRLIKVVPGPPKNLATLSGPLISVGLGSQPA